MAYRKLCTALLASLLALPAATTGAEAPKPGDIIRDCPKCPEMVVIPAGTFIMGRDNRHKYERPAHKVTIARPFAMGKYEVTFDEWETCLADGGCTRDPDDHKWGRGRMPVMNITWADARDYASWLREKTGQPYRLLTEAEWEWAAGAGTTTKFWWGDDKGKNHANCRDCGSKWSKKGLAPVGSFAPNPFGLYDTAGNSWEWVEDCWNPSHVGAPADGSARLDGDCRSRVMRSGSWYYIAKNVSTTWRFKNIALGHSYGIGFRVARDLP
ncbi:MAG: SUMF1/EgtB/PvdO family nonheme iron enzyme [Rhodospirillales bacterium]|jgi:formylglycine-generating enzyme required for sulfatase activity|nr:SUMF1/EgtB/PvdO family nonheme iron enzyme [Rhodospirillales bacterium]HJO72516.1 SUMF1/EgtB/PvdO family nonheme iron enzyme [Rhodospirillales bacterium]